MAGEAKPLEDAAMALAFFASAIRSGESWSVSCAAELEKAYASLGAGRAEIDRLRSERDAAREALASAIRVAGEAREEWDKAPSGMRAGKILIALSGHCPRYRADIDAIHAVLNTPLAGAEGGGDG